MALGSFIRNGHNKLLNYINDNNFNNNNNIENENKNNEGDDGSLSSTPSIRNPPQMKQFI